MYFFTKFSESSLPLDLFVMMSQILLNSEVVWYISFMCNAWLYGILSLKDLERLDCAYKYVCWSVGLLSIVFWILCYWSPYTIVSRNSICLVDILHSHFVVLCFFLLIWSMNNISSSVVTSQIMKFCHISMLLLLVILF